MMHNNDAFAARSFICPICQEEVSTVQVTKCGHIFHKECIIKAIKVQNRCPSEGSCVVWCVHHTVLVWGGGARVLKSQGGRWGPES